MDHSATTTFFELKNCLQRPDEPRRRWFCTSRQDLIVWFGADDRIVGFRLSHEQEQESRSLTWSAEHGAEFHRDARAEQLRRPRTSLLVRTGRAPQDGLAQRFAAESKVIDPEVATFVENKIRESESSE